MDKRAEDHIKNAQLLYEMAVNMAKEKWPAASDYVIRNMAMSLLSTAGEICFAHCGYQSVRHAYSGEL